MNEFVEHGDFRIVVESQTLMVDAKGPFNVETIENYHAQLKQSITSLAGKFDAWNQIIILHEESLFTPDAEAKLHESVCWRVGLGLKNSAVVLVNPVGYRTIRRQMLELYKRAGVNAEVFNDVSSAKTWLESQRKA